MSDMEARTGQYVALRDMIKSLEEEHKTKLKPYKDLLADLGSWLHNELKSMNVDNVSSPGGTVYITKKKSASIADLDAFWNFVVSNQAFDLLDKKANSTAVEDFANANGVLPPGVNFSTMETVGVRRPNEKA